MNRLFALLPLVGALLLARPACAQEVAPHPDETGDTVRLKDGIKYWITRPGAGARPQAGQKVWVHYTGKLDDGRIFDTSAITGKPLKFAVGRGDVIPGIDEVVGLMRVGQRLTCFIPSRFGYGPAGQQEDPDDLNTAYRIPPNADLIFDLELVKVQ